LKAWRYKLINSAGDDLISRQPQQLAGAEAGVQTIAVVVCDEDGLGRVVEDSPEQQLKFSGAALEKPLGVSLLCAGGTHGDLLPAPSIQGAQATSRDGAARRKYRAKQLEAENGG
jgi:hypothetical protein